MKKQSINGGKPPAPRKKLPKARVFGANAVQLSEDEANQLIGGIVEKCVSDDCFSTPPSTAPLPSVLPFPVARHRSHGPHWAPYASHSTDVGGATVDDEFVAEDDDPTNYDSSAQFAEPIIKKKKKGLDLSQWRELVQSTNVSNFPEHEKNGNAIVGVEKQKMNGNSNINSDEKSMVTNPSSAINDSSISTSLQGAPEVTCDATKVMRSVDMISNRLNESSAAISNVNAVRSGHDHPSDSKGDVESSNVQDGTHLEISPCGDVGMGSGDFSVLDVQGLRKRQPTTTQGPSSIGHEERHTSIEGQIDAENQALLERMSPEEIAEAQAEIRNRINPELLKILKKRGLQKSEKLGSSCSTGSVDIPALGVMQANKHLAEDEKDPSVSESAVSPPVVNPSKLNTETRADEGDKRSLSKHSKCSNLWDMWSKRVESVRTVRFSFDGNVIEESSLDPAYTVDNVGERDYLRMEGEPGAAGYTIKEALALARSVVPGQRALALHLLESVLSKALLNICESRNDCLTNVGNGKSLVDWAAIWAYALGPEPELVLSLRLALDDNHYSVVLASAKVIQCILACDVNESFFNTLEKMTMKNQYTAPVFRTRPDIRHGFLGGGFWKYSTKPSNILLPDEEIINDKNEEPTIQDDNVIAEQDVAAGLVRMAMLPRLLYLLETEPSVALEECILSILVAVARHSPTCATAIWKCERLVQTIVNKFTMKDALELQASKIKSVTLLRVLAQSSKNACIEFIQNGFFQTMTWHLYRVMHSIDEWIRSGKEKCKLTSELMVEQLRFWKVCVMHGHCISSFTGFFPALCLWLNPPTFDKLIEANVFHEFVSISMEVYLVLETLARRLPDLHSTEARNQEFQESCGANLESWCWNDVGPMVDMALKWLEMKADSTFSKFLYQQNGADDNFVNHSHVSSLLWVLSAVMHMLNTVLKKATPGDVLKPKGNWRLPEFVAKLLLQIIKKGILNFSDESNNECSGDQWALGSFVVKLCEFRHQSDYEMSIASVCCLHGLLRVIVSTDHLIQITGDNVGPLYFHRYEQIRGNKLLQDGIFKCSLSDWRKVISEFVKLVTSEWHTIRHIEAFGRGGPAPGVGVGWGTFGGGFWSSTIALVQADSRLLIELLGTFHSSSRDLLVVDEHNFMLQSVNSALATSLVAGPGDEMIIQNVLDILMGTSVLKYLDQCIFHFLHSYKGVEPLKLDYKESDFIQFGKILASHFRHRWLSGKKKKKSVTKEGNNRGTKTVKLSGLSLDTIPEDMEASIISGGNGYSIMVEWARQRLPLPSHWLLSPIVTIGEIKSSKSLNTSGGTDSVKFHEVARAGIFFLLGIEAMASRLSDEDNSPVRSIPFIWKLHGLSVPLLVGMDVLEDERSRFMYGVLQSLYGQLLDELWLSSTKSIALKTGTSSDADLFSVNCLRFQSEIHENYSTFIETLVEQFAAISYGDVIYGRQIAIYLHRQIDASIRLATWNALSNAHVLELLPPLINCVTQREGYLEPSEDDEGILEAYVKSWTSGSLDRAAARGSMTYAIAVHHLSSFIFNKSRGEKLSLRNKLVKSLLRDFSRKQQHEAMMLDLVQYEHLCAIQKSEQDASTVVQMDCIDSRLELLKESCEGNSQLLTIVEKLKSSILNKQSGV
ncbi:transcriptional elongation regulator MINIYO-like [Chenopodium quinoa]|uniref:transcriptional elongation regulator MINIYO-like n=1 Tax=Chenopodium quinoa TaxID=63459 RepID=UPI000B78BC0D|nr:transcriptional elongation regulator MINIYO-like [Chenopodium quinoa]